MELLVNYEATELVTNFEDVKNEVITQVEKYSLDVTDKNLPEAKKVMADLNKVKSGISAKYKQYIDTISQPINKLKSEKKELEEIITDGRQKIADGVAVYENKRLGTIKQVIEVYKLEICESKEIEPNALIIDDLVKLSAVTTNGTITKATKEAIDLRVQTIENEILKAKLEAEREAEREREIARKAKEAAEEQARQREAELLAKAEREKLEAVEKAKQEAKQAPGTKTIPPRATDDGKCIFTVRATFEVKANQNTSHEKIQNKLQSILQNAGITTCTKIEVLNA